MPTEIQTVKKSVCHEVYDCGCWVYRESFGDQTLVLKMQVCSLCMALQFTQLEGFPQEDLQASLPLTQG